jgi:hypothetical protein
VCAIGSIRYAEGRVGIVRGEYERLLSGYRVQDRGIRERVLALRREINSGTGGLFERIGKLERGVAGLEDYLRATRGDGYLYDFEVIFGDGTTDPMTEEVIFGDDLNLKGAEE